MEDKTIIAAILLITVGLIQVTAFILGFNGQVLILTTNVIIGVMTYYFTRSKFK